MAEDSICPPRTAVKGGVFGHGVPDPRSPGLAQRVAGLAFLFILESIALSIWLDTATLSRTVGLTGIVGDWGPPALRSIIAAATVFVTFAYLGRSGAIGRISAELTHIPVRWSLLAGHGCALIVFVALSFLLFTRRSSSIQTDLLAAIWLGAGILLVVTAGLAIAPLRLWLELVRSSGRVLIYASVTGAFAYAIGPLSRALWQPVTGLTFSLVRLFLQPFIRGMIADPATRTIGTESFNVQISPQCSGIEGGGLMIAFGVLWLWFFRKECRFPRALVLIPAGVMIVWILNAVRIAALILIGNAGAPSVALGGFHSQAGWIAFNCVALGLSLAAQRVPWLAAKERELPLRERSADNPTAAYLMPFLMILAAAMVSRAASGGFEWLYPLRFFAAAAALWFYRSKYAQLDWSFGWFGLLAGGLVFVIWLALDRMSGIHTDDGIGSVLGRAPAFLRFTWIALRTLAAVVTVPIAEELAFRGYLVRRLISRDFESVGFRTFTLFSVVVSSIAFGLLHGNRWIAGALAGSIYAAALLRRGRIGDAVAAHATTNALLAVWVLTGGRWYLW